MKFFLLCEVYATIRFINPLIREIGYQVPSKMKVKLTIDEGIDKSTNENNNDAFLEVEMDNGKHKSRALRKLSLNFQPS